MHRYLFPEVKDAANAQQPYYFTAHVLSAVEHCCKSVRARKTGVSYEVCEVYHVRACPNFKGRVPTFHDVIRLADAYVALSFTYNISIKRRRHEG